MDLTELFVVRCSKEKMGVRKLKRIDLCMSIFTDKDARKVVVVGIGGYQDDQDRVKGQEKMDEFEEYIDRINYLCYC